MIGPLNNFNGGLVDWWFAYKLPADIGPNADTSGFEFLYVDSDSADGLSLSKINLNHENSAIGLTLGQLFSGQKDTGFILWNDEIPPSNNNLKPENNESKGHSKGILAFSKSTNSGFYLLHSTPRFPFDGELELPIDERKFGQTYLCVSFENYQIANDIAEILLTQHQVQVYNSSLPLINQDEFIWKLANNINSELPTEPAKYKFNTMKGVEFQLFAKNKAWSEPTKIEPIGKDLWEDLIAVSLASDLTVETWRRGLVFEDADSDSKDITEDVLHINLSQLGLMGYQWPFTKDHAKWGISNNASDAYVIIADINRQVSQRKRGGGGLVFNEPLLWKALKAIEASENQIEKTTHTDKI